MTTVISRLLSRYERGTVTRRELIAALSALAAGATTNADAGLKVSRLDHISLQVSDLQRSREFYGNVFTASVNRTPRPDNEVRLDLADNALLVLRRAGVPGQVNHLGVKVEGFNRASVAQQLRGSGITPVDEPNVPGTAGFHVVDPDGFRVQLLYAANDYQASPSQVQRPSPAGRRQKPNATPMCADSILHGRLRPCFAMLQPVTLAYTHRGGLRSLAAISGHNLAPLIASLLRLSYAIVNQKLSA